METYGGRKSQGSWGILPFVLTSTSKVRVAKKADRSFLKERFNIETPLESLKGVIKLVGGCLKLIKEKETMKERCQMNMLPKSASYFY